MEPRLFDTKACLPQMNLCGGGSFDIHICTGKEGGRDDEAVGMAHGHTKRSSSRASQPVADHRVVFHSIWNIKTHLLAHGRVANPRDTTGYRCGLRLALTQNASFLLVPSRVQHHTRMTQ